jgi:hypothetical protein
MERYRFKKGPCSQTHLFYPPSECDSDGVVYVKCSPIQVQIHRVDIEKDNCIGLVEGAARHVLENTSMPVLPKYIH